MEEQRGRVVVSRERGIIHPTKVAASRQEQGPTLTTYSGRRVRSARSRRARPSVRPYGPSRVLFFFLSFLLSSISTSFYRCSCPPPHLFLASLPSPPCCRLRRLYSVEDLLLFFHLLPCLLVPRETFPLWSVFLPTPPTIFLSDVTRVVLPLLLPSFTCPPTFAFRFHSSAPAVSNTREPENTAWSTNPREFRISRVRRL